MTPILIANKRKGFRRGATMVLMAFLLPVICILASLVINIAYAQLSRTELMVATDAATRAGGRAFSEYQDVDDAMTAAKVTAGLNSVAGSPLRVSIDDDVDIRFGDSTKASGGGRYQFTAYSTESVRTGSNIASAIRIDGKMTSSSDTGALSALFPAFGMQDTFDLHTQAVAMQLDRDIALVLDRSGSMDDYEITWPDGYNPWGSWNYVNAGVSEGLLVINRGWIYPNYAGGINDYGPYYEYLWEDYWEIDEEFNGGTLWNSLVNAVETFLQVLDGTPQSEQVSVATYASSGSLDLLLDSTNTEIMDHLRDISPDGATAIGSGMREGIKALIDQDLARAFAAKTMIVMTDGIQNTGDDADDVARELMAAYNLVIHTVTFGSGADQVAMREVAEIGGGTHYHADDASELLEVFEQIANNLPTIVTK